MEEPRTSDDAEKDEYPPDTEFGRAAAADQERVDAMAEGGDDEGSLPEGSANAPRAGGKAEPDDGPPENESVDEASEESFPASDPPSSTGSAAGG